MSIILNQRTTQKLSAVKADLPHALLLHGERGVGLTTIAKSVAGSAVHGLIEPTDSKGNANHETGTIAVETIRTLYEQTRAKTAAKQIIIIDSADRMSLGAQAAFLKLLEEPNEHTHFILTTHSLQQLLPTVRSRVQIVLVEPISPEQTQVFLSNLPISNATIKNQLEYLASGLPAELQRLISDEAYFKQRAETMSDTRMFLTGSIYEKLLVVHKYHQDRVKALQLVDSAIMVSRRSINVKPVTHLVFQLENLLHAREKIESNCNIRLQLASLVMK